MRANSNTRNPAKGPGISALQKLGGGRRAGA
jgi:hypothetical protein